MHPPLCLQNEEGFNARKITTARIASLLDVKFNTANERELAYTEFGSFLKELNYTGEEVREAYKMAISKKIKYKVFPTLSTIQLGEIMELYGNFKYNNPEYNKTITKLLAHEKPEISKEDILKADLSMQKIVFEEIKENNFSDKAHVYYETLREKGKVRSWSNDMKKRFFKYVEKKLFEHEKSIISLGPPTEKNRIKVLRYKQEFEAKGLAKAILLCKSIFASNYLKNFDKFKDFKKEIT